MPGRIVIFTRLFSKGFTIKAVVAVSALLAAAVSAGIATASFKLGEYAERKRKEKEKEDYVP